MIFRFRFIVFFYAVLTFALLTISGQAHSSDKHINIAVLPCSDVVKTFERFKPLTAYLEKEIGISVQTIFPANEKELMGHLKDKTADFVFQSPHIYQEIAPFIDENSIIKALSPEGTDFNVGYLIARQDSGVQKITDLKGKSVLFGMECSASRLTAGKKLFTDHEINIEKDLNSFSDGGCCEDICFNVFLKAVDAGLVCKHYYDEKKAEGAKHTEGLIILGETDPMPTRIFAARKDFSPEITTATIKALLAINPNDPELKDLIELTEIHGFIKADPQSYETLIKN